MFCYNPAPVRRFVKEFGDERDGGENKKMRGVQKKVFKWAMGNRCGTSYLTHTNTGEPAHTHTQIQSPVRSEMWSGPLKSLLLSAPDAVPPSWHLVSFTPSLYLLNTILSLVLSELVSYALRYFNPRAYWWDWRNENEREPQEQRMIEREESRVLSEMTGEQR